MPKKKVPGKPKEKKTAYTYFYQACRELLKERQADKGFDYAEFSQICSQKWKVMSAEEKVTFKQQAKVDKQRFEAEVKMYALEDSFVTKKRGKEKRSKDPNAPKWPLNAFWFSIEERPKLKSMNPKYASEFSKELGRMWARIDPEQRERYKLMAAKDKQGYEREMEDYKNNKKSNGGATPTHQQQQQYEVEKFEEESG